jgi:hypothetical protein
MRLKRRDVLVGLAGSTVAPWGLTADVLAQSAPSTAKGLHIFMRGSFLVDTTDGSQAVRFFHLKPSADHVVALTCPLADLDSGPEGGIVTTVQGQPGQKGETVIWVLTRPANKDPLELTVEESASGGVRFNATSNGWDGLNRLASVPDVTGVANGQFKAKHKFIQTRLQVATGRLEILSPSNEEKGSWCWKFKDKDGKHTKTLQVSDSVMYHSASAANAVRLAGLSKPWTFKNEDVQITLTSLPLPGLVDLAHFPHFAQLFGGAAHTPVKEQCETASLQPSRKLESGTAYCPPGKRP